MNLALSLQQVLYKQCLKDWWAWKTKKKKKDWSFLFVFSINRPSAEDFLEHKNICPFIWKILSFEGGIDFLQIAKCTWESNIVNKADDQVR